jgi:hypothetical protein
VYDVLLFSPEGICFADFVAFVACYIMQFLTTRKSEKTKHAHMKMEINRKEGKTKKTKHAHMNMEINGNATKTNTD